MEWRSKFSGPNTSTGFLLWQATQSWQRKVGKALAEFDLTHVQFVLLTSCKYDCSRRNRHAKNLQASARPIS